MTRSRLLIGTVLPLVAACGPCCYDDCWDPVPPSPDKVEVLTSHVYAKKLSKFKIQATVTSADDRIIAVDLWDEIDIQWTASGGSFDDPTVNPAIFTVPDQPETDVTISVTVTRTDDGSAPVQGTAQVHIAPDPGSMTANGERITTPHATGAPPSAVLLDSNRGAGCTLDNDRVLAVVQEAFLDGVNMRPCLGGSELVAFAAGREMKFLGESDLSTVWTNADGDEAVANGDPQPGWRQMNVVVGLSPELSSFDWMSELASVQTTLNENRMGIELAYGAADQVFESIDVTADLLAQTDWCGAELVGFLNGRDLAATPDLFVIIVREMYSNLKGKRCPVNPTGGSVIFLSHSDFSSITLAHELGHALSLVGPHVDYNDGHAFLPEFALNNIMWAHNDPMLRKARSEFTAGQVYRMNVHQASWLNRVIPVTEQTIVDCQVGTGADYPTNPGDVCPALDEQLGEEGG